MADSRSDVCKKKIKLRCYYIWSYREKFYISIRELQRLGSWKVNKTNKQDK